jgi:hypothetical protein
MTIAENAPNRIARWSAMGFVALFLIGAVISNVATTEPYPRPQDP